ncbi:hypothetical protein AEAC466_05270 [Asticcacaulis sp. AC466]|uniref:metallophosphoesterase n=1 Tax=Asticcacaulis sp. AC466 TaxID=1282362 RepID=UPI0003C40A6B|nr:metallophosphoesterase [Asticcacaulis sp. AC466]ESQ85122.1 hypothetical protein AEAC466_05270 [Asticcacaulis sp. AC466]
MPKRVIKVAVGAAVAVSLAMAFWFEPENLTVTRLDVQTPDWPSTTAPIRVVLLSDFHIGGLHMPIGRVRKIADQVKRLHPDLVLLGGDYIGADALRRGDERLRRNRSDDALELDGIKALGALEAPLGVVAVMGNHDCYWDCQGVKDALSKTHIRLLQNDSLQLKRKGGDIWIEGIEDGQTQHPDFPRAAAKVPANVAALTLVHNPGLFDWSSNTSDLQLSGHTHAGQVRLPLIGAPVRMSRHTEDTAKGWTIINQRILIVTRGLGESGLPVRLNAPPQIMVLTIHPGSVAAVAGRPDEWIH